MPRETAVSFKALRRYGELADVLHRRKPFSLSPSADAQQHCGEVEATRNQLPMADVFISYSRKDKDFVRWLHEALSHRDQAVWVCRP
jgi:hypothetical protein